MEIHRQQCQSCGSHETRNIIVRETGHPPTVYVRCSHCGKFVARYRLSEYYHHGKGLDSFLRSYGLVSDESGRDVLEKFEEVQRESLEGYERVLENLKKEGKDI